MAAHFGDMLLERRRAMGMSIQQVANIIKIRPQIIEFIETENLEAMPPRGYAQGMISSYARYLGLNPRVVVDAYFDALNAYEHGTGAAPARYREQVSDASPRSANATVRFMMVDSHAAASRFAQRPPQAGYVSEGRSPHEPVAADELRPMPAGRTRRSRVPASGYPSSPQTTGRIPVQGTRSSYERQGIAGSTRSRRNGALPPDRGVVPPRGRAPRDGRAPYGGRGSVDPRRGRSGRGGQVPPRSGNRRGGAAPSGFSLDPRLLIAVFVSVLVLIVLLAVLLLRGCAPKPAPTDSGSAPKAEVADRGSADTADDTTDEPDSTADDAPTDDATDAGAGDDATAADGQAADGMTADGSDGDTTADEPAEIKVKVSLKEKDAVAFIEVKVDGKSVLGAQQIGPFSQEFTVTQQIEITTDKPSDVTVTKDGKKVPYDMKVSGVAKVTISVPQPKKDESTDGQDADGQNADGQDGTDASADSTSADQQ